MKVHFYNSSNPISTIEFSANFNVNCNTNKIYKRAAIWVLPFIVGTDLATTLNSSMSAAVHITRAVTSANKTELVIQKILQSYPEVVNYIF